MTLYVAFGDSIIDAGTIPETVASLTGMTVVNVGIGQTQFGPTGNAPSYDKLSAYGLVDAIVSGQWSAQIAAAAAIASPVPNASAAVDRLMAVDFSTVDIVTMSWGTNDFGRSLLQIGSNSDTQPTTFKGAVNYTLKKLMTACPTLKILLTTPIWRGNWNGENQNSDTAPNLLGQKLVDFADALLETGDLNHVPVADLYRQSGINSFNAPTLLQSDRIPPE